MLHHRNQRPNRVSRKVILLTLLTLALLFLIAAASYTRFFMPKAKPTTASTYTKGAAPTPSPGTNNTPSSTDTGSTNTKGNGGVSTATLLAPSGVFVSSHHVNLNSSTAESSVCNTTPGATCTIRFTNTNSGAVKELRSQTTDAGGAAYWSWKVSDIGLSAGVWKVEATASLGAQTKATADALNLEITQ